LGPLSSAGLNPISWLLPNEEFVLVSLRSWPMSGWLLQQHGGTTGVEQCHLSVNIQAC